MLVLVVAGVGQQVLLGVPGHREGGGLRDDLVHLLSRLYVALCRGGCGMGVWPKVGGIRVVKGGNIEGWV